MTRLATIDPQRRYKLVNHLTGTEPIHVHANGGLGGIGESHWRAQRIYGRVRQPCRREHIPRHETVSVEYVTYYNRTDVADFVASCRDYGETAIVLGQQHRQWKNRYKSALGFDHLRRSRADIIVFSDAIDAVFVQHPNELINRFLAKRIPALMSAEKNNYPDVCTLPPAAGVYPYGNSGGIIGQRDALLELFRIAKDIHFKNCDQYGMRLAADRLNIPLDTQAELFQTLAFMEDTDLDYVECSCDA